MSEQWEIVRADWDRPYNNLWPDDNAPSVSEIVEATRYFMNQSRKVLEGKSVRDYDEAWSRLDNIITQLEDT